ncbi:sterile alpha motif domain-containing protein 12-like isoform X3 [Phyllobates terribilis]|uniref:sterile alpha motif domain-containing protein 12-like isoform X3 n=1 Tax=Phyllobates terribilis TaxID=111132 RepID=UPI003CCB27D3
MQTVPYRPPPHSNQHLCLSIPFTGADERSDRLWLVTLHPWTLNMAAPSQGLMSQESEDEEIWEKPVSDWSVQDVCSWLQYGPLQNAAGLVQAAYSHHISGRALLRLTDNLLQRMGIQENLRQSILVEVLELKLQQEIQQLLMITECEPEKE